MALKGNEELRAIALTLAIQASPDASTQAVLDKADKFKHYIETGRKNDRG